MKSIKVGIALLTALFLVGACASADNAQTADTGKTQAKAAPAKKIPGPFTVYFDLNSAELTDEGFAVVANAYDKLRWAKLTGANVQAHTDTSGTNLFNAKLSAARMDAVVNLLKEFGLEAENISKAAYGENKPGVKTDDGVKEAKNRRVVITLK